MVKLTPRLAVLFIVLLGVPLLLGGVQAGGNALDEPIIYDWLNNSTDEEESHVSNYNINGPVESYFSSGLEGSHSVEDEMNETENMSTVYRVYDDTYREIPTTPVYDKWNSHNVYDYEKRPYVPGFKISETKTIDGMHDYSFDSGSLLRKGWTGIYSIQPSTYVHYKRNENDSGDVTRQVVGDSATVYAVVDAKEGEIPNTDISGEGVGATRHQYSFGEMSKSSDVFIKGTEACQTICHMSPAPVSQSVAEGTIDIDEYANPGEQFQIIVRSTITLSMSVDEDNQIETQKEVECEDEEDDSDSEDSENSSDSDSQETCYETVLEWEHSDTFTEESVMTMKDSQNVTYPEGVNSPTAQEDITYKRGFYPNGTTAVYINTRDLEGTMTERGVWRKIQIGERSVYSNWRVWSARNVSWDSLYVRDPNVDFDCSNAGTAYEECKEAKEESNDGLESHIRPLAFHAAPIESNITVSSNDIKIVDNPFTLGVSKENPSPLLQKHHTCHNATPSLSGDEWDNAHCGWWLTGENNELDTIDYKPYLEVSDKGNWNVIHQTEFKVPDSVSQTKQIEMYGMIPNNPVQLQPDREVKINETELYAEIVDDNIGEEEKRTWVEVQITLVDPSDDTRITTSGSQYGSITVDNSDITGSGEDEEYVSKRYNTTESGQVTVKVYNPKRNGIYIEYKPVDWKRVPEGQQAYAGDTLERDVAVPALSMTQFLKYLLGFGALMYLVLNVMVRFMNILQMHTSVSREFEKMFPNNMKRLLLFIIILYFVLSLI